MDHDVALMDQRVSNVMEAVALGNVQLSLRTTVSRALVLVGHDCRTWEYNNERARGLFARHGFREHALVSTKPLE